MLKPDAEVMANGSCYICTEEPNSHLDFYTEDESEEYALGLNPDDILFDDDEEWEDELWS